MANWEYFPEYRMNGDIIDKFLAEIFGSGIDFGTQV
jgi:hypothetical protein